MPSREDKESLLVMMNELVEVKEKINSLLLRIDKEMGSGVSLAIISGADL